MRIGDKMNIFMLLRREEGLRLEPYYCSENYPTIGIGTKIGPKNAPLKMYQFKISEGTARQMLDDEVFSITARLSDLDWYNCLSYDMKTIVVSMAYQMGVSGVLKFKRMIAALERGDFNQAATEALDSKWAKQTINRSRRHARVLGGESLSDVYGV